VLFDARGSRVYAACYRTVGGRLEELVSPLATRVEEVLEGYVPPGSLFVGEGALRHRDRIVEAGYDVLPPPAGMPTAPALLQLLDLTDPQPLDDHDAWEPEYLRPSSAERERLT
jgi:tRNA A37 threonylcarbamoyladenosine modification protein TsaB